MKIDHAPLALLIAFVGRLLIFGASIGDSIALIGLAGLFGYTAFLATKKPVSLNDKALQELESMKSIVAGLRMSKPSGR